MSNGGFLAEQSKEQTASPEIEQPVAETPEAVSDPELLVHEQERAAIESEAKKDAERHFLENAPESAPVSQLPVVATDKQTVGVENVPTVEKDEITLQVEKILEDGLEEHFKRLPEEAAERFQSKGVETATRIAVMVRGLKVQAKRVILLIRDWLLTIPGVNKFFLEQEAKIKTDRILELERDLKARSTTD